MVWWCILVNFIRYSTTLLMARTLVMIFPSQLDRVIGTYFFIALSHVCLVGKKHFWEGNIVNPTLFNLQKISLHHWLLALLVIHSFSHHDRQQNLFLWGWCSDRCSSQNNDEFHLSYFCIFATFCICKRLLVKPMDHSFQPYQLFFSFQSWVEATFMCNSK